MRWYEALPDGYGWQSLWYGYAICSTCGGIRSGDGKCQACGKDWASSTTRIVGTDGRIVISETAMGAEGRYEDYIYLQLLEREWKRPVAPSDQAPENSLAPQLSVRASIVILFWSYFETRIDRLLRGGMRDVPPRLVEETLRRNMAIGSRLDRLYQVLFETTYGADLSDLGFDDIRIHLLEVQKRRNDFAHGQPNSIDDSLVQAVVDNLKRDHEAWIAVYNRRATHF